MIRLKIVMYIFIKITFIYTILGSFPSSFIDWIFNYLHISNQVSDNPRLQQREKGNKVVRLNK